MTITPRAIALAALGALAFVLFAVAAAISAVAPAPGDASVQAQQGEHRLFAPGLVSEAEGTYVPFATLTPSPTPTGVQDAPNRYFVSIHGDNDNDGTSEEPFASIAFAVDATEQVEDREIYVDVGFYEGTIVVRTPLELHGGYHSTTWERIEGLYTVVSGTSGPAIGILAGNVTVSGFELRSGELAQHQIAVSIEDASNVVLHDLQVEASDGAPGSAGLNGVAGAFGSSGANGQPQGSCLPENTGGSGGAGAFLGGTGGTGGLFGGFDGDDGQDASAAVQGGAGGSGGALAGGNGGNGGRGDNGTATRNPGAGGSWSNKLILGLFDDTAWDGEDGVSTRTGGAGGGGGGGGGGLFDCGGGGGGGGGGGHPAVSDGMGGQGGGASFGLVVIASSVAITDSLIATGSGGDGGTGGGGGGGGLGGPGGSGPGTGGDGGAGGDGADSTPGGGGAGGPSIGILADPPSTVEQSGNVFQIGPGGTGGQAVAVVGDPEPGHGQDGFRADFYQGP